MSTVVQEVLQFDDEVELRDEGPSPLLPDREFSPGLWVWASPTVVPRGLQSDLGPG